MTPDELISLSSNTIDGTSEYISSIYHNICTWSICYMSNITNKFEALTKNEVMAIIYTRSHYHLLHGCLN